MNNAQAELLKFMFLTFLIGFGLGWLIKELNKRIKYFGVYVFAAFGVAMVLLVFYGVWIFAGLIPDRP